MKQAQIDILEALLGALCERELTTAGRQAIRRIINRLKSELNNGKKSM